VFDSTTTPPHRALYLRWRPKRFEDVVGQEHVTRTLRNAVKLERLAHAYLFTGPRGTGKTSVARILYRAANCLNPEDGDPCSQCALCVAALEGRALDLVEIDAASNRGIDDIRELRDKVAYRPGEGRYRAYIIDEAHELTGAAWDAFLKTLEEPPPHAIFVLATTAAHKVPPTIVSRCQRFDFRRIPYEDTRAQLERVARAEGMQVEPVVLERLALMARGGLRDALSLLDQLEAFASGPVDMTLARAALSLPSIEAVRAIIEHLTTRDAAGVMATIADAVEGGADLRLFAEELVVHLRALLLMRAGAASKLDAELPTAEVEWLRERAGSWPVGSLMRLIQEISTSLARTRDAQQFQVQVELALLAACDLEASAGPLTVAPPPPPAVVKEADQPINLDLQARWPDVIDHVKSQKPMLAALLSSAQPVRMDKGALLVAFSTDFNRKRAEMVANRQIIEEGAKQVLGQSVRLECTIRADGAPSLLEDPVINYAARTFGGQPRRVE
jgi:DNA polymerase-3 subunit gamma/tau